MKIMFCLIRNKTNETKTVYNFADFAAFAICYSIIYKAIFYF